MIMTTRSKGFSLVELMVAITIGFVVIGALGGVFLGSRQSYRVQDGMSRIQENGRFAMDALSRDIRQAGYIGCAKGLKANNIASPVLDYTMYTSGIIGFEAPTLPNGLTSAEVTANTDLVRIQFASSAVANLTGQMLADNANIQITGNANNLQAGDILMISDCSKLDVFKATNVSNGAPKITIAHAENANTTNRLSKAYQEDAELMRLETVFYYVGPGIGGVPTLFRKRLVGSALGAGEEIAEGVQDMQIVYGEDTNGDQSADRYVTAPNVGNMENVVSVRVDLLLRSLEQITTAPVAYTFAGAAPVTPTDRLLRRVFSTTVNLRNRTP